MKNITLFELCRDYDVPCLPFSYNPETISRWYREHKPLCVHYDGLVTVDYPEAKEDYITVCDGEITDTSILNAKDVDINIYLLILVIKEMNFKLYFLSFNDGRQLVSGIEL